MIFGVELVVVVSPSECFHTLERRKKIAEQCQIHSLNLISIKYLYLQVGVMTSFDRNGVI